MVTVAFTKTNWNETIAITPARLNNMELQLEEAKAYTDAHEAKSAPHSGHATVSALNSHINSTNPHAGYVVSQSDFDAHINANAPHPGHVSTSTFNSHTSASAPHSGHATTTALNAHTNASAPHSGHATTSALNTTNTNLNNHRNAAAPHSGHVKGSMTIHVSGTAPSNPSVNDIWIVI